MAVDLKDWRKRKGLTQVEAAGVLGVSQAYLSLMERGARPVPPDVRQRMRPTPSAKDPEALNALLAAQLSALGYPGFGHLKAASGRSDPAKVLTGALLEPDLEPRVAEGMIWLAWAYAEQIDWPAFVRAMKMANRQNRAGFVLDLALQMDSQKRPATDPIVQAREELYRARLVEEDTFCWDSMSTAIRNWMRENRYAEAAHWNVLSRVRRQDLHDAA